MGNPHGGGGPGKGLASLKTGDTRPRGTALAAAPRGVRPAYLRGVGRSEYERLDQTSTSFRLTLTSICRFRFNGSGFVE